MSPTPLTPENLPKTIFFHRKRAGLSRENLAKLAGVGISAIYKLETGKGGITLQTFEKICHALNIMILLSSPIMSQCLKNGDNHETR